MELLCTLLFISCIAEDIDDREAATMDFTTKSQ